MSSFQILGSCILRVFLPHIVFYDISISRSPHYQGHCHDYCHMAILCELLQIFVLLVMFIFCHGMFDILPYYMHMHEASVVNAELTPTGVFQFASLPVS